MLHAESNQPEAVLSSGLGETNDGHGHGTRPVFFCFRIPVHGPQLAKSRMGIGDSFSGVGEAKTVREVGMFGLLQ